MSACRLRAALSLLLLPLCLLAPRVSAQVLAPPANVAATPADAQVILTWSPVAGATGYSIYRSRTPGGEGTTPYTTKTTPFYVNTSVTNGSLYYYTVATVNGTGTGAQSGEVSATPLATLATFYDNSGGGIYPTGPSHTWAGDYGFSGGAGITTGTAITGTSDPALFQDQRAGTSFSYSIPVTSAGTYIVSLSFAEIEGKTTGQRVFSVASGSQTLLDHFDIYAAAGSAGNKAVVRSFTVSATTTTLPLTFTGNTGSAAVAAIQVSRVPTSGGIISGVGSGSAGATDIPAPGWAEDAVPTDEGSDADGEGPSEGQSVSLPSGSSENAPGPDLWSYNPLGPAAAYSRLYRSRRADTGYNSPGLSPGWTDNYDEWVRPGTGNYTINYPNGAKETWTGTTGTLTPPSGSPYLVQQTNGTPAVITVTTKDRMKYTFTQFATAAGNYPANAYLLTKITNLVGRSLTLNRDTSSSKKHRLTSIVNDAATPLTLLSFAYSAAGQLQTLTDAYSRQISYTFDASSNLSTVSQIVATGTVSPPIRRQYGYTPLPSNSAPYLTAISSPDPSAPGSLVTAYVDYYDTGSVAVQQDADGSSRFYSYGATVQTQVSKGSRVESWQQKYSATKNVDTGFVDGAGKSAGVTYSGTPSPYLPNAATNRNGQITQVGYDAANTYGNVVTTLTPRNDLMTLTYQYPTDFLLGQVQTMQESHLNGSMATDAQKQATTLSYYGTSDGAINGLVKTAVSPAPDSTISAPGTVTTSYTYTLPVFSGTVPAAGGQPLTVIEPGNTTSSAITTTYNYTTDGAYSQNEAVGEPLTVTDNLSEVTHLRYDARGNVTSVQDAIGNITQFTYNLADQRTSVIYPATGMGSGNAHTDTNYQYVGGPPQSVQVYDENGTLVREVDYGYTHEGNVASVTGSTQPATYTYDERSRVAQMTDGNGHSTFYDYDLVGNLAHLSYPNQNAMTGYDILAYSYDDDQNLTSEVDGRGVTKTYTRSDPESLVTQVAYSTLPASVTAIASVNYTYDVFGRRLSMNDGDGSTTGSYNYAYSNGSALVGAYDDLDNLLTQTVSFTGGPQSQTLKWTHNPDGTRLSLNIPTNVTNPQTAINGGNFSYTYDGVRRLTQMNVPFTVSGFNATAGDYLSHSYYYNGWLAQTNNLRMGTSSPDAATQATYTYNPRGFLTKIDNFQYNGASHVLEETSWFDAMTYDAVGNRLGQTNHVLASHVAPDASRTLVYTYDTAHGTASQNRDVLTAEASALYGGGSGSYSDVYTNNFTYDGAYNPTAFALDGSSFLFPVNSDNQITSSGFAYDGDGNPTSYQSGAATFAFDPEDRLTAIPSSSFTAAYDGDGLRIKKTDPPIAATYFLYDGDGVPVVEEQMSGSSATLYALNVLGADGWRARSYVGSAFYAFSFDPEGNAISRQNSGDALYNAYATSSFEAYGKRGADFSTNSVGVNPASHQDPIRFGGQFGYYTDYATGLVCLTHRYYDPGTGKFLTRDPIGYQGGVNLYGFCDGNPVNESDPSGYAGGVTEDDEELIKKTEPDTPENDPNWYDEHYERTDTPEYEERMEIAEALNKATQPKVSRRVMIDFLQALKKRKLSPTNYPNPDPPLSEPPVHYEPQSVEEVVRMRTGNTPRGRANGSNAIEAHHRQQIPVRRGGVIDELTRSTHREGGNHTRHRGPSQMTPIERDREIRQHYRRRGGEYILPGEGI